MTASPRVCSVARTLELVGERWALLALREAFLGVHRFERIQRNTGAPRDILAARLKKLVAAGILEKRLYQEHPPRYEYHLTEAGRELHPVITALRQWGDRHLHGPDLPAPARFVHVCGGEGPARFVCPDCGQPVAPGTLRRIEVDSAAPGATVGLGGRPAA